MKRAKQRQIDNLLIDAIETKKSDFSTLQVAPSSRLKTADHKTQIGSSR